MSRMSNVRSLSVLAVAASVVAASSTLASATFTISSASTVFSPSFRGASNTTYFGWGSGAFDGATDDSKVDSPAPTLGTTTAGVNLVQTDPAATIVSSSNNIYTGLGFPLGLNVTAPTAGTPGTGFTTIIIQGKTAFADFGSPVEFGTVAGVSPNVVTGVNAAGSGQFFTTYDIPGNASSYVIPLTGGANISLNNISVDTLWSPTAYAADVAVAPEPASLAAILGTIGVLGRRRRFAAK